jgi:IclR family transcriptional regulator, acetate operon repressor
VGTISKALEMLDLFSRARPEIGLSEFVRLTGRDKATVHRHLSSLQLNGFVEQNPASRAYRLGPAILRLSALRETTHPLRSVVRPLVIELANAVGELAHVSILQGKQLSPVYFADPRVHGTQIAFDESEFLPLHATSSGLAVLAFAPPALLKAVLKAPLAAFTAKTICDPDALRDNLVKVHAEGVSLCDGTFDLEVTSLAVPLFDSTGATIGSLAVAMPRGRAEPAKLTAIRTALLAAGQAITRSLGGVSPSRGLT